MNTEPVFFNVRDFGAKGDGVTDDTAALRLAVDDPETAHPGQWEQS